MSFENTSVIEYFVDEIKRLRKENTDLKELLKQYEEKSIECFQNTGRDKSRYIFDGKIYLKNQLVLAIVHKYFNSHKKYTAEDLMEIFHDSLQGSLGVIRKLDDVKKQKKYHKRFFTKEKDIIHTCSGDCCVCSLWSKNNINNFIIRANQLGFEIEKISR